jgi:hypothetical protein
MKKFLAVFLMLIGIGIFGFTGSASASPSADVAMDLSFGAGSVSAGVTMVGPFISETWATVDGLPTVYNKTTGPTVGPPAYTWVANSSTSSSGPSSATASSTNLASDLNAHSIAMGNSGMIDSKVQISGYFQVAGSPLSGSNVVFTGSWTSPFIFTTAGQSAYGFTYVDVLIKNITRGGNNGEYEQSIPSQAGVTVTGSTSSTPGGTAPATLYMYGGDIGYFQATVEAKSQTVPIPGAMWLLGSGLVGLVGIRRRFQK